MRAMGGSASGSSVTNCPSRSTVSPTFAAATSACEALSVVNWTVIFLSPFSGRLTDPSKYRRERGSMFNSVIGIRISATGNTHSL